ncbi:MAG: hypothetical protein IKK21_12575 [Clostridia bacterium]|nr:hypothetical protein [Clostridia bacterium]
MHDAITFGTSLTAFMKGRGLSVAALARLTGEKSATTVSRLIHDQSAPKRCAAFLTALQRTFPDMTEDELRLLQQGLSTSQTGLDDAQAQRALDRLLHGSDALPAPTPLSELLLSHADADVYELYCIQCTDNAVLDSLTLLLAGSNRRIRVCHFIVAPLPGGIASYTAAASRILCDPRYTVRYLAASANPDTARQPGNVMLLRTQRNLSGQQLLILPQSDGQMKCLPLESVDLLSFMLDAAEPFLAQSVAINLAYELNTPRNCLAYLSGCYDREVGRACYLLRPGLNLAMVPVELMQTLYNDATALQQTSVKNYALELRRICYLRHANRVEKPHPTYIIFSRQSLEHFIRSGMLLDHFRSLRPFTPAERRQILLHLIHLAETMPTMHLHIARDEQLFRGPQLSCYDGGGVLLSPVISKHVAAPTGVPYCEAFIQDVPFARQFQDYYLHTLLPNFACDEEESLSILRALAAACGEE